MYLLFPGRHHLLTNFQFNYLFQLIHSDLSSTVDVFGNKIQLRDKIEGVVFAVTSSNHSGTKRNPLPFHLRAMMIQEFSKDLGVPSFVYGIEDVGTLSDFASYTLKTIFHESNNSLKMTPENTVVVCSTGVMDMYIDKGFQILPAELINKAEQTFSHALPWDITTAIAKSNSWNNDDFIMSNIHPAAFKIWQTYGWGEKVKLLFNDPIIGEDGDITESRDYNSYVRQMDEIAELKYNDTAPYIKPGNIGDIGCAVGSWMKLASEDNRLTDSDFYGIEVARQLFDICHQRKHNGEFASPSVFFAMKNAVTDLVFEKNSMDTIHTSSLTHEIESYGSHEELLAFIKNRYEELKQGGVWINRDVVGPENGDSIVYMWLNKDDGSNENVFFETQNQNELAEHLNGLSTFSKFIRFAQDFRKAEGYQLTYEIVQSADKELIKLKHKDAADFMLTKDYTDNWQSEMHETFCFWSFTDWKNALEEVGFSIRTESKDYQNPWIAENRWYGKVELYTTENASMPHPFPPTNMLMVAEKTNT